MRTIRRIGATRLLLAGMLLGVIGCLPANAQNNVINPIPIRAYSSATVTPIVNLNPNLVEGREFFEPMGIAVDPSTGAVYVADTFNHRVLGFANYLAFENGAAASLVLGQADFISTNAGGLRRVAPMRSPTPPASPWMLPVISTSPIPRTIASCVLPNPL